MINFTDEQQELMAYLEEQLQPGGHNVVVSGRGGVGKAIPLDTVLPTPSGFKQLQELKEGDFVFDRQGKPTKIKGFYPQGVRPCYEVTFSDGRKVKCCDEHLWTYVLRDGTYETKPLKDLMGDYKMIDDTTFHATFRKYRVPANEAVEYEEQEYDLDPYVGGLLCQRNLFAKFENGSVEQRREFVKGFLHNYPNLQFTKSGIELKAADEHYFDCFYNMFWSLGLMISPVRKRLSGENKYAITIRGRYSDLIRVLKKPEHAKALRESYGQTSINHIIAIDNIQQTEDCEMACIEVDNEEHLFLTEQFVVTHNTVVICEMVCRLLEQGLKVAVTAMTGKATAVLRNKIEANIEEKKLEVAGGQLMIETLSKITKTARVLGLTQSGDTIFTANWKNPESFSYDVLFVDELSMVPHYVSYWWLRSNTRVFGFGDECQLPEVTTDDTKKEIDGFHKGLQIEPQKWLPGYGIKVLQTKAHKRLENVLRSTDEIAALCGELRDFKRDRKEVINTIRQYSEKAENISYSRKKTDMETSHDWQILCYKNATCKEINSRLCIGKDYPDLKDKILLNDNVNPLKIYNGETFIFEDLLKRQEEYNKKAKIPIFVCIKWQGKMPSSKSKNPVEKKFAAVFSQFKREILRVSKKRIADLPDILNELARNPKEADKWSRFSTSLAKQVKDPAEAFSEIIAWFEYNHCDIAKTIVDKSVQLPRLYMTNADYGYAITTHKAQGSEYEKVCYLLERFDRPLLYTGLSRAKKQLKVIDLTK